MKLSQLWKWIIVTMVIYGLHSCAKPPPYDPPTRTDIEDSTETQGPNQAPKKGGTVTTTNN